MPTFNDILEEVGAASSIFDLTRRRYLQQLHELTGRNVIVYYSGFLQKPLYEDLGINERDKNGFMAAIHGLDKTIGLDLIIHTPGGDVAATESIAYYLHQMFGNDIRIIVPQIAMSGGTMLALSAQEVVMGKHSSLGPIDPQIMGMSAHGVLEEWQTAFQEMKADNSKAFVWHMVLQKYPPTLVGDCEKAIQWANEFAQRALVECMFERDSDAAEKAEKIVNELSDHSKTKSHSRRITMNFAKSLGIKVVELETDSKLQEEVMSIHHATMLSIERTPAYKIIENHKGVAHVLSKVNLQMQSGMD